MIRAAACALLMTMLCSSAFAAACCPTSATCPAVAPVPDNTLSPAEASQGFHLLFDGKTLNGWASTGPDISRWVVSNNALTLDLTKPNGYLYTKQQFGNFELKIDFMVDRGANSGLFFRWADLKDPVQTGIEMQIYDTAGKNRPEKHDCGAVYDILAPSENAMKPALEWNSVILKCWRNFIAITMNGKRIIQLDLDKYTQPHKNVDGTGNKYDTAYKDMPRAGHIGMQDYGNKVWYKNIKIREL
jgi:hypothetical protein